MLRTRDFAEPTVALGAEQALEPPPPGPQIRLVAPRVDAVVRESIQLVAETEPVVPGETEYLIPGFKGWTPVQGNGGRWEAVVPAPPTPGRHFLAVQFKGENGAVVWAHAAFRVAGEKVQEVWAKDLGSAIQGAPAIWRDLVIVPTRERGVYALRLTDGEVVWRRSVEPGQVLGRAAVDGGAVFYGAGRVVYACEARTGRLLWQTPVKGTMVAGLTASAGRVYAPAGENRLYCLDACDGKTRWEYAVDLPILMEPVVGGGKVFFGAMDGFFRALDDATGEEVWKHELSTRGDGYPSAPYWPPALVGDKVIVSKRPARKEEKSLIAFRAASGKIIWSRQAPGFPSRLAVSPEQDRLYAFGSQEGRPGLQCLSVEDGAVLWRQVNGVGMYAAVAGRDEVVVRDAANSLCCVEADTGAVKWLYRVSLGPQGSLYGASSLAVKDNLAVVGTMDGQVLALKW